MSEWGRILFYYDYEIEDTERKDVPDAKKRVKGVVSKAYKYPEIEGLFMHGANGMASFLTNYKNPKYTMDTVSGFINEDAAGWDYVNEAFDSIAEDGSRPYSVDSVLEIIDNLESFETQEPGSDEKYDLDKICYYLCSCEGTDGFLYFSFTGDPENGYKAKYGYYCGYGMVEEKFIDIKTALRIFWGHNAVDDELTEELLSNSLVKLYENSFERFESEEEFWGLEDLAAKLVVEIGEEIRDFIKNNE